MKSAMNGAALPPGPVTTRTMVQLLLGQTMQWWYRHGRQLREEHGFPKPLPGFGRRKWDPRHVDAWLLARMPLELQPAPVPLDPPPAPSTPPDATSDPAARARKLQARIAAVVGASAAP